MAQIEVIRHVAFEDLGILADLFAQRGDTVAYTDAMTADFSLPRYQQADLLVVLGAPIGAYDEDRYPFLNPEIECIQSRLQHQQAVLGICLGAQLLARLLGATVQSMPAKEIGYAPLRLTEAGLASPLRHLAGLPVLHWHGDQFTVPATAVELADTVAAPQAFAAGQKILALQFHLEADARRIEHWLVGHACELAAAGIDVNTIRHDAEQYGLPLQTAALRTMTEWLQQLGL